ncbi:MAG TPA: hypothetical protein DCM31_07720 [Deferribacteraceae bacterium]|nr:hypothetical protein [Deferribacteraceae bacterium]
MNTLHYLALAVGILLIFMGFLHTFKYNAPIPIYAFFGSLLVAFAFSPLFFAELSELEIRAEKYQKIHAIKDSYPAVSELALKAMKDGKITEGEYREILALYEAIKLASVKSELDKELSNEK